MTGKTQSYARQFNNRLIMRELRAEGRCSATMLANKLDLSNAALTYILFALQQKGYIKRVEQNSDKKSRGRRPVYYSVNENFGCVAVVELANRVARVVVADMNKTFLYDETFPTDKYDMATLYQLIIALKEALYSPSLVNLPLLAVELSMAGRVNTQNGQLQMSPQFDGDLFVKRNSVVEVFEKHFNVPVSINNDVNLALLGEVSFGLLKNAQSAMLVLLDEGVGGAFVFDGKPYLGVNGFAGEIGLMHVEHNGTTQLLDECVSLRAVKKMLSQNYAQCQNFDDVSRFFENDENARAAVLSTACTLGNALKDVVELVDISTIVLCGRLSQLSGYVETVQDIVRQSPACAKVLRSEISADASVLGAVSKAVDFLTDSLFD